jgi:hypothetical protein
MAKKKRSEFALSKRWYKLRPHPEQKRFMESETRFLVVPAGRRSGKTERAKRKFVKKVIKESKQKKYLDYRYFCAAPTYGQAKKIYWNDLKQLTRGMWLKPPSETELKITLTTGAEIWVIGMDKPERAEGVSWNGCLLDEFGNMKPSAWQENIRPALSDRGGWAWFIGVPEGRNHYYDLSQFAKNPDNVEWDLFHWISADILPASEIASAKNDMDELTYLQEYEGSFVNFEGRAYYPFDDRIHCAPLKYDPRQPLILCFDFNVAPGTASIIQEQLLPNGEQGTGIIGEVHIPRNSNTPAVCARIITDWGNHQGRVICYGDATGGSRGSAKVAGSDWELISQILRPHFKEQFSMNVPKANPLERTRVNAVNSRLLTMDKRVRMMIDPRKAPHVVKDLEGVTLLKGGSGEIDKKATPELTHLSDGFGYYINQVFPIGGAKTTQGSLV